MIWCALRRIKLAKYVHFSCLPNMSWIVESPRVYVLWDNILWSNHRNLMDTEYRVYSLYYYAFSILKNINMFKRPMNLVYWILPWTWTEAHWTAALEVCLEVACVWLWCTANHFGSLQFSSVTHESINRVIWFLIIYLLSSYLEYVIIQQTNTCITRSFNLFTT